MHFISYHGNCRKWPERARDTHRILNILVQLCDYSSTVEPGYKTQDASPIWRRQVLLEQSVGQDLHCKTNVAFVASKDMNRLPVLYLEVAPVSFANQNTH